jgi:polysaccharide chain length determinant protein (PEP-CTERM system associated)
LSRELLPHAEESIVVRAFGIIRRRAAIAIVVFAAVLAAAVAFALYLPDLYRAHAIVLVERPLGDVVRPTVSNELESRLHVIKQTILSRDRLTQLVNQFHLYPELREKGSFEDVLNQARQDIDWEPNGPEQVSGRSKTVTFTLTYTGDDKKTVADVTNAVVGFYVDYNNQMRSQEAQSATQFIKMQLDAARAQVDQAEARVNSFVAANQSQLPQAASVNAVTYTRLGDDLRRNREQQARVTDARERHLDTIDEAARAAAATATPAAAAATALGIEPSKELTELSDRLDKARTGLADLIRKGLADFHPDVRTAREQIASLEQDVEAQRERDVAAHQARQEAEKKNAAAGTSDVTKAMPRTQRNLESYDQELNRLKKEEAQIQAEMNRLLERFDSAPGVQQQYLLLQRDYTAAKDSFDVAQRRYQEAKQNEVVETSGQGERFRVLEAAIPPDGPSAPNRIRLLILGLLLALAAGAAAVVAREQLDTSFHTIDDVREFTSIPVLASIPEIGMAPRRGYVRLALGTVSAVAAIILVGTLSAYIANGNETLVRMLQRAG